MTPREVLSQYFGYDDFRKGQGELIEHLMAGQDVLGIMPTGAGKSLCYQVPSMLMTGLTVVISPLISLMQDQVDSLRENGIPAGCLNSAMEENAYQETLQHLREGRLRLLYAAPERLETPQFLRLCHQMTIPFVAVDEAHCVSQWGHDFRPSYLKIADFLAQLPQRPVIGAFTATATQEVAEDIIHILGLQNPYTITTGFDRENLYFGVDQPRDKFAALVEILRAHEGSPGIVYCATRKLVEEVTAQLCQMGFRAGRYHAGLTDVQRREGQNDFLYDRVDIMVATNAFGMGIDKSNVRFVVHYNMPRNLENYYQEAGRAGRDGSPADCILLYAKSDVHLAKFFIDNAENDALSPEAQRRQKEQDEERLKRMTFYCTQPGCLRHYILRYFGEASAPFCGNCSGCQEGTTQEDITETSLKILSCIYRLHKRKLHFGVNTLTDILRGKETEKIARYRFPETLPTFGILSELSEKKCKEILNFLLAEEWIAVTGDYAVLSFNANSVRLLRERPRVIMRVQKEEKPKRIGLSTALPANVDKALYEKLKALRKDIAVRESVPAYVIFTDNSLIQMCQQLPVTDGAFLAISGVGHVKLEKYGSIFMDVIRAYKKKK